MQRDQDIQNTTARNLKILRNGFTSVKDRDDTMDSKQLERLKNIENLLKKQ